MKFPVYHLTIKFHDPKYQMPFWDPKNYSINISTIINICRFNSLKKCSCSGMETSKPGLIVRNKIVISEKRLNLIINCPFKNLCYLRNNWNRTIIINIFTVSLRMQWHIISKNTCIDRTGINFAKRFGIKSKHNRKSFDLRQTRRLLPTALFLWTGKQETTFWFSKRIETDIPRLRSNLKGYVVVIRKTMELLW